MEPTPLKILRPQLQRAQLVQVFPTHANKFIQQLPQRLTLTLSQMPSAIEGHKGLRLARLQDHLRPRHPVHAFSVN